MAVVLILEPDPDLRALAIESLAELGHAALLPAGADAGARVDLVLIACGESRGAPPQTVAARWARVPVVCVGDEPVPPHHRSFPSAGYLVRPYSLEALARALDDALGAAPRAREAAHAMPGKQRAVAPSLPDSANKHVV